jgi:hypothetical protein
MTNEQERHLDDIKYNFIKDVNRKYRHGQDEHGGDLWLKPGMIDHAIDEVIDLAVYLYTIRDQINGKYGPINYNQGSGETISGPSEHSTQLGENGTTKTS